MKMMLPKIEVGLMKTMHSCYSIYAKDFACTSACTQTSLRPNVLQQGRPYKPES